MKLKYDGPLSNFAFNFYLRRYTADESDEFERGNQNHHLHLRGILEAEDLAPTPAPESEGGVEWTVNEAAAAPDAADDVDVHFENANDAEDDELAAEAGPGRCSLPHNSSRLRFTFIDMKDIT